MSWEEHSERHLLRPPAVPPHLRVVQRRLANGPLQTIVHLISRSQIGDVIALSRDLRGMPPGVAVGGQCTNGRCNRTFSGPSGNMEALLGAGMAACERQRARTGREPLEGVGLSGASFQLAARRIFDQDTGRGHPWVLRQIARARRNYNATQDEADHESLDRGV